MCESGGLFRMMASLMLQIAPAVKKPNLEVEAHLHMKGFWSLTADKKAFVLSSKRAQDFLNFPCDDKTAESNWLGLQIFYPVKNPVKIHAFRSTYVHGPAR